MTKKIILICIAIFGVVVPNMVLAASSSFPFVSTWTLPAPSSVYAFGSDIHVMGTWQLPPDWAGNIYVYLDGVQVSNTLGEQFVPISSIGGVATTSGAFDFNIGPKSDGTHSMQLVFWGGENCAINTVANANDGPFCVVTKENFVSSLVYPVRIFSVDTPDAPRIEVVGIKSVHGTTTSEYIVNIRNTGKESFSGQVIVHADEAECLSGCTYELAPSAEKDVRVSVRKKELQDPAVGFTCVGKMKVCVAPVAVTLLRDVLDVPTPAEYSPLGSSRVRVLTLFPDRLVIPEAFSVNVGGERLLAVRVRNSGDGYISGEVISSPGKGLTCIYNCTYERLASTSPDFIATLRFAPLTKEKVTVTMSFTDRDDPASVRTFTLDGGGNISPVVTITPLLLDFGAIEKGSISYKTVVLENTGVSVFHGAIQNVGDFSCIFYCALNLSSGSSTPVVFSFKPSVVGDRVRTLRILDTSLVLRGAGVARSSTSTFW